MQFRHSEVELEKCIRIIHTVNMIGYTLLIRGWNNLKLFLYGASGAALEVYDMVVRNEHLMTRYSEVIFIDDFQEETVYYGTHRIRFDSFKNKLKGETAEFVVTVGEPSIRHILRERIEGAGYRLATLIDKSAVISPTAQIGEGCIINYGGIISSNVILGKNVFVMFGAIIGHDAIIGEDVTICPKTSIGAHCHMGDRAFVGIGASIIQGVDVGNRSIIGMGSMVFRTVEHDTTVIGNPARVTKGNDKHKVF